jgi:hypothetical protein
VKYLHIQALLILASFLFLFGCQDEEFSIESSDDFIKEKIIKNSNIEDKSEGISIHHRLLNIELEFDEGEEFLLDNNPVYYKVEFVRIQSANTFKNLPLKKILTGNSISIDFEEHLEFPLKFRSTYTVTINLNIFNSKTDSELKNISKLFNFKTYGENKFYESFSYQDITLKDQNDASIKELDKYLIPIIKSELPLYKEIDFENGYQYKNQIKSISIIENATEEQIEIDTSIIENSAIAIFANENFLFEEEKTYSAKIELLPLEYVNQEWTNIISDNDAITWNFNFTPKNSASDLKSFVTIEPNATDIIPVNQPIYLKLGERYSKNNYINIVPNVKNLKISSGSKLNINATLNEKPDQYLEISPEEEYEKNSSVEYSFNVFFKYEVGNKSFNTDISELPTTLLNFNTGDRIISIIDTTNIKNSYPFIRQRNYFKKDSDEGFISFENLKSEAEQLIENASNYTISFIGNSDSISKTATFSHDELKMTFQIPNQQLNNNEIYKLKVFADASVIYEDYFRTSQFDSFKEKIENPDFYYSNSFRKENSVYKMLTSNMGYNEGLDQNEYNCISAIAIVEKTDWFTERCIPLFYDLLKYDEFTIDHRDTTIFGVPPRKAIYLNMKTRFLEENEILNNSLQELEENEKILQTSIDYHYVVDSDYASLRNQANNCKGCIEDMEKVENLKNSVFPYNWKGTHYFEINYENPITGQLQSTNEKNIEVNF